MGNEMTAVVAVIALALTPVNHGQVLWTIEGTKSPPKSPFPLVAMLPAKDTRPVTGLDIFERIDDALAEQHRANEAAWYAWELSEWLRVERENADRAERERAERARAVAPVRAVPIALPASGDVWAIIEAAALRHGIDPARFARIAWCESGGNPNAYNPSGASGLFQQLRSYWPGRAAAAGLPGANVFDPYANAEVSAWLYASSGPQHWNPSRHCWG